MSYQSVPLKSFENTKVKDTKSSTFHPQFDIESLGKEKLDQHLKDIISQISSFPIHVFPEDVQTIIKETNESLNFPVEFIASALLHASGTAIGNTHFAKYKWEESAVLNMALVGNPGTIKSHTIDFAYDPIADKDRLMFKDYKEEYNSYEAACATWSKKDGAEPPQRPILKKHIVSDCTIEALVNVLKNNKRGVCSYNDELAGWLNNMNRYNSGSDLQQWLSMWSGKAIVVDRKSSGSERVDRPFVSVIGTIQPGVLDDMAKDNKAKNGFIDRILFVWPKGLKRHGWTTKDLNSSVKNQWAVIVRKLLNLNFHVSHDGSEEPNLIPFSQDAEEVLRVWQAKNIQEDEESGTDAAYGISAKIEIYVLRFSLILQLLRWACGEAGKHEIDVESVKSAIQLAKYFKGTALEVAGYINSKNPVDRLPEIKQLVYRRLPKQFATEMAKNIWSEVNDSYPEDVRLTIRTLENWLKDSSLFTRNSHGHYTKNL